MNAAPFDPRLSVGVVRDRQWVRTLEIPADADPTTLVQERETSWPESWGLCVHHWLKVRVPRFWRRRYTWTCADCGARWAVERAKR